jgi:flagellar biosynthetic protein FliQ
VNASVVVDLAREMLVLCLLVSIPMLATAMVVGFAVSLLQAVTAVHEQTLSMVPKLVAVLGVALLVLPWSLGKVVTYAERTLRELPRYASGP